VTQKQQARQLVRRWLKQQKVAVVGLSHIHHRAYVIARPAPMCLVVAVPWMDMEPQLRALGIDSGVNVVRRFDDALRAGDWCATAYVQTATCGESVAVK